MPKVLCATLASSLATRRGLRSVSSDTDVTIHDAELARKLQAEEDALASRATRRAKVARAPSQQPPRPPRPPPPPPPPVPSRLPSNHSDYDYARQLQEHEKAATSRRRTSSRISVPVETYFSVCGAAAVLGKRPWEPAQRQEPRAKHSVGGIRLLRERFERKGWTMRNVESDGACQFRALAQQLWGDEEHHAAVRATVVRYLREHPPLFHETSVNQSVEVGDTCEIVELAAPTYEEYCDLMSQPTTWGDQITLRACASAYGATVCLITTWEDHGGEEWYQEFKPPDGEGSPRPEGGRRRLGAKNSVRIGFHSDMHYVTTSIDEEDPKAWR